MSDDRQDIAQALAAIGLGAPGEITRLSGGVSCDVWKVEIAGRRPLVLKRALPKLRVTADWRAPPERAAAEVAWIRLVAGIEPRWVPAVLGEDPARHMFAMQFLEPETHPVWKAELAAGRADSEFARQVGAALARIHAATAGKADIAAAFDNRAQFAALRLEPYLAFTAGRHPGIAQTIYDEIARIAAANIALMQGDISPKNILCGPHGPVFLDAETACFGDPAFDLAFCLNHFLLKSVWHPQFSQDYERAFHTMKDAYRLGVTWERPSEIGARTARLLPILLLARVDGKSPVEYLTDENDKAFVRAAAMQMIFEPPLNLNVLAESYFPVAAQR
jgi:aminoglycoside phosphotransferase (APT) family kinase protein